LKILFIGDIVGRLGRKIVKKVLFSVCQKYDIDFVIANGENASHGKGLLENQFNELLDAGVDCVTLGNHYDSKNYIRKYIDSVNELVRPVNILQNYPGEGSKVFDVDGVKIRVTNVLGTIFMNEEVNNPFVALTQVINETEEKIHIVDFHCETTSEKEIMGFYFDGRVSAVLGTHTHVQTRDYKILDGGTGYISDVGMCGGYNSVLGFEKNSVMNKIIYGASEKFQLEESGKSLFNAVVLDVDEMSGKTREITPIYLVEEVE